MEGAKLRKGINRSRAGGQMERLGVSLREREGRKDNKQWSDVTRCVFYKLTLMLYGESTRGGRVEGDAGELEETVTVLVRENNGVGISETAEIKQS